MARKPRAKKAKKKIQRASKAAAPRKKQPAAAYVIELDWKPAARLNITTIRANGTVVVRNAIDDSGNRQWPLPLPDAQGQYTIVWSIFPDDQGVNDMKLRVINQDTSASALVDSSGPKAMKDVWANVTGKTVNAP